MPSGMAGMFVMSVMFVMHGLSGVVAFFAGPFASNYRWGTVVSPFPAESVR